MGKELLQKMLDEVSKATLLAEIALQIAKKKNTITEIRFFEQKIRHYKEDIKLYTELLKDVDQPIKNININ